jgi:hypothetical protein
MSNPVDIIRTITTHIGEVGTRGSAGVIAGLGVILNIHDTIRPVASALVSIGTTQAVERYPSGNSC